MGGEQLAQGDSSELSSVMPRKKALARGRKEVQQDGGVMGRIFRCSCWVSSLTRMWMFKS